MRVATVSIFSAIGASAAYSGVNVLGCSQASTTRSASAAAPAPPLPKPSLISAANAPASRHKAARALEVGVGVAGAAVDADDARHAERGDVGEVAADVLHAALERGVVVAAAVVLDRANRHDEHRRRSATRLPIRQTMSKNFVIPMSEPKPDSVTT